MTINKIQLNIFKRGRIYFAAIFACVLFAFQNPVYSIEPSSKAFNLITVVDNFLNLDGETKSAYESIDEKTRQK